MIVHQHPVVSVQFQFCASLGIFANWQDMEGALDLEGAYKDCLCPALCHMPHPLTYAPPSDLASAMKIIFTVC